jgi:hypothetical protein
MKMRFLLPCLSLGLGFVAGCARVPPATAAMPGDPGRVFLSIEDQGRIVAWSEITSRVQPYLGPDLVSDGEQPGLVIRAFEPAYLGRSSLPSGLSAVTSLSRDLDTALRHEVNRLLEAGGNPSLTHREFREAIERHRLTCHFAALSVMQGQSMTGEYAGVSGVDCVNNLLFWRSPPDGPWPGIMLADGHGLEARAGETIPATGFVATAPIAWDEIRPIMEDATEFNLTPSVESTEYGVSMCIGNVSRRRLREEGPMVNAVVSALVRFLKSEEGLDIVRRYDRQGEPSMLWEDPCLPLTLEGFLREQAVPLLVTPAMQKAGATCRRSRPAGK